MVKCEYVRLRNFRAVWKGRGGDQELSAEVIRAPVKLAGTPFSISLFALNILAFLCSNRRIFSVGVEMHNNFGHIES